MKRPDATEESRLKVRTPTNCMEAFKRWWAENEIHCKAKGINEVYAWMVYRAGWHGEPK